MLTRTTCASCPFSLTECVAIGRMSGPPLGTAAAFFFFSVSLCFCVLSSSYDFKSWDVTIRVRGLQFLTAGVS